MANLGQTFSEKDLPEGNDGEFLALPAGDYQVRIIEATLNDNKAGTGQYIKLRMDVIGPTHQGRVIFSNLNIRNQSEKAEQIGLQQLGEVIRAIGLPSISDTDQLVGGNLVVRLKVKDDAEYGDANGKKNEVSAYKAIVGSKPPQQAMPRQSAPQPAAAGNTPPWVK